MALRESNGGKVDVSRLTDEEKRFFEDITDRLKAVKAAAMDGQGYVPMIKRDWNGRFGLRAGGDDGGGIGRPRKCSRRCGTERLIVRLNVFVRIIQDIPSWPVGRTDLCILRRRTS